MTNTNDNLHKHHRRSIRLAGYDYRAQGAYFVTICAYQKKCVFGRVLEGEMQTNIYGQIVGECWNEISNHFPHVVLDQWIVMPNHFHGILVFSHDAIPVGARYISPPQNTETPLTGARYISPLHAPSNSLGSVVGKFKAAVTRRINQYRAERGLPAVKVWQRNFYERIIRDEKELSDTQRYIDENPLNWAQDEYSINAMRQKV
jgi:putative transposase